MPVAWLRCQGTEEGNFGHKEFTEEEDYMVSCVCRGRAGGAAAMARCRIADVGGRAGTAKDFQWSGNRASQISVELQAERPKNQWSWRWWQPGDTSNEAAVGDSCRYAGDAAR